MLHKCIDDDSHYELSTYPRRSCVCFMNSRHKPDLPVIVKFSFPSSN
jgi:hypothetical protein